MQTSARPGRSSVNRGRMLAKYGAFRHTIRENSHLPPGSRRSLCQATSAELPPFIEPLLALRYARADLERGRGEYQGSGSRGTSPGEPDDDDCRSGGERSAAVRPDAQLFS